MDHYMVKVRGACKSYGNTQVLKNLDLTLKAGTVYSLLGASGSGKTTLLNCIVGNLELDKGTIELDLSSRIELGYMPQDIALYDDLSLWETFSFFGRLFDLSQQCVTTRLDHFTQLLELPDGNIRIKALSGGEQRRVSLAVAFLGDPKLLILDEPTVGLDALLRECIWKYLLNLAANGRTVMITTHYIEEARDTDTVALLREGSLLTEGKPDDLIEQLGVQTLEQVYFVLSMKQENTKEDDRICRKSITSLVEHVVRNIERRRSNLFSKQHSSSTKRINAFILKTLYWIKNNMMLFYFTILLPGLLFVILVESTKQPKGMRIAISNQESDCAGAPNDCKGPLSCRYVTQVARRGLELKSFDDEESAIRSVEKGEAWAALSFRQNFSDGVKSQLEFFRDSTIHLANEDGELLIWMDMTNFILSHYIRKAIYDSYFDAVQEWYESCGWNSQAARIPIKFQEPIHGTNDARGLTDLTIPLLVFFLPATSSMALGAVFVMAELEKGTQARCKVYGLTMGELLVSQFVAVLLIIIPECMVLILIMYFYVGLKGNLYLQAILYLLGIFMSVLTGLFLSTVTNNFSGTLQFLNLMNLGSSWFSGLFWPPEGYHWFGRKVAILLPLVYVSRGLIAMTTREHGLLSYDVYTGFISVISWILIFIVSIYFTIRNT